MGEGHAMLPHLVYDQLTLMILRWLCIMLPYLWPSSSGGAPKTPPPPMQPKRRRSREPKPFAGLTHTPHGALCEQEPGETAPTPPQRPEPRPPPKRRPRPVDTSRHCCPPTDCDYRGWLELNNLRATGPPHGGPWRQLHCTSCAGDCPAHHGTSFHGKQAEGELIVRVLRC